MFSFGNWTSVPRHGDPCSPLECLARDSFRIARAVPVALTPSDCHWDMSAHGSSPGCAKERRPRKAPLNFGEASQSATRVARVGGCQHPSASDEEQHDCSAESSTRNGDQDEGQHLARAVGGRAREPKGGLVARPAVQLEPSARVWKSRTVGLPIRAAVEPNSGSDAHFSGITVMGKTGQEQMSPQSATE